MKTFQSKAQLAASSLQAGQIVQVLGELTPNLDGQAFYAIYDSGDSASLPTDRVTLANSNIAAVTSIKVRKRQEMQFDLTSAQTVDIDLKQGINHTLTIATDVTTLSFSNIAAYTGVTEEVTLKITQDGTGNWAMTWPVAIIWASGITPTIAQDPASVSHYRFITYDNGVSWFGFVLSGDFIPVADIDVTVLGVHAWTTIWDQADGDDANGQLFPELINQEVIFVCDEVTDIDEISVARGFIPQQPTGYETNLKWYLPTGSNDRVEFIYLTGAVNVSDGSIRIIYARDRTVDLPDIPVVDKA
tara:strand:+ start:73 stop:978 length:906 start_codon:yes stop_codon:yes gene_type:complete